MMCCCQIKMMYQNIIELVYQIDKSSYKKKNNMSKLIKNDELL